MDQSKSLKYIYKSYNKYYFMFFKTKNFPEIVSLFRKQDLNIRQDKRKQMKIH